MILASFPAPYRVNVFKGLAETYSIDVFFQKCKDQNRSKEYFVSKNSFNYYVLDQKDDYNVFKDCVKELKKYDLVLAYDWYLRSALWVQLRCIKHKIPYIVNCDGAFLSLKHTPVDIVKNAIKKYFIKNASMCLASGSQAEKYFKFYGAKESRIVCHPFTSLYACDIYDEPASDIEKRLLRKELGIKNRKTVITIGQFIPRKGFDVLLNAWNHLDDENQLLIIGGGKEYARYKNIIKKRGYKHVYLIEYKPKEILFKYYRAADIFVFPTHEDIWGLVINEAMACGLPIISTYMCLGAVELIESQANGILIPDGDIGILHDAIFKCLSMNLYKMGCNNIAKIKNYTYENVIKSHEKAISKIVTSDF